jgi:hypothetical protein
MLAMSWFKLDHVTVSGWIRPSDPMTSARNVSRAPHPHEVRVSAIRTSATTGPGWWSHAATHGQQGRSVTGTPMTGTAQWIRTSGSLTLTLNRQLSAARL